MLCGVRRAFGAGGSLGGAAWWSTKWISKAKTGVQGGHSTKSVVLRRDLRKEAFVHPSRESMRLMQEPRAQQTDDCAFKEPLFPSLSLLSTHGACHSDFSKSSNPVNQSFLGLQVILGPVGYGFPCPESCISLANS